MDKKVLQDPLTGIDEVHPGRQPDQALFEAC